MLIKEIKSVINNTHQTRNKGDFFFFLVRLYLLERESREGGGEGEPC